jgi:phosphatidylserine decarboxylase
MIGAMAAALLLQNIYAVYASLPLGLLFLFFLAFFRDPERVPGRGIVSPADGRVLHADAERGVLTVFMNLHNVHVNRAPWDGRVTRMTYTPGGHAPAYRREAAHNERLETVLDTDLGQVRILQVAGVFARRIVPYRREGDRVKKGQRIGMIRFGSRVELTLPRGVRLVAKVGDRVRAGETTVAVVERGAVR